QASAAGSVRPAFKDSHCNARTFLKFVQQSRCIDACASGVSAGEANFPSQPNWLSLAITPPRNKKFFRINTIQSIPSLCIQVRSNGFAWDFHQPQADKRALRTGQ